MSAFPSDAQWAAVRALAEGALPTHSLLAAALRVGVPAISHRARREAWALLDFRRAAVRAHYAERSRLAGRAAGEAALEQFEQEPAGVLRPELRKISQMERVRGSKKSGQALEGADEAGAAARRGAGEAI